MDNLKLAVFNTPSEFTSFTLIGEYEYRVVVTPVSVGLNMTKRPDDGSIYYEIQLITADGQILTSTFIPPVSILLHRTCFISVSVDTIA